MKNNYANAALGRTILLSWFPLLAGKQSIVKLAQRRTSAVSPVLTILCFSFGRRTHGKGMALIRRIVISLMVDYILTTCGRCSIMMNEISLNALIAHASTYTPSRRRNLDETKGFLIKNKNNGRGSGSESLWWHIYSMLITNMVILWFVPLKALYTDGCSFTTPNGVSWRHECCQEPISFNGAKPKIPTWPIACYIYAIIMPLNYHNPQPLTVN